MDYQPNLPGDIASLSPTLEDVHFCGVVLLPTTVSFTQVHSLRIEWSPLRLNAVIPSFPNLRHLHLHFLYLEENQESRASIRSFNKQFQVSQCWKELDTMSGHIVDMHTLGLTCSVRSIRVIRFWERDQGYLAAILHDNRPAHLILEISNTISDTLPPFLPAGISWLKHFELVFTDHGYPLSNFDEFISDLILQLQFTSIVRLYLRFRRDYEYDDALNIDSETAIDQLQEVDHNAVALQIASKVSSIKQIGLEIENTLNMYWDVDSESRAIVQIQDDVHWGPLS